MSINYIIIHTLIIIIMIIIYIITLSGITIMYNNLNNNDNVL